MPDRRAGVPRPLVALLLDITLALCGVFLAVELGLDLAGHAPQSASHADFSRVALVITICATICRAANMVLAKLDEARAVQDRGRAEIAELRRLIVGTGDRGERPTATYADGYLDGLSANPDAANVTSIRRG